MRWRGRRRSSAEQAKGTASARSQPQRQPLGQCAVVFDAAIPVAPSPLQPCACPLRGSVCCSSVARLLLVRDCCWRVNPPPLQLLWPMLELHWTPLLNLKRYLLRLLDDRSWPIGLEGGCLVSVSRGGKSHWAAAAASCRLSSSSEGRGEAEGRATRVGSNRRGARVLNTKS